MDLRELSAWLIVLLVTIVAAWMVFAEDSPDAVLGGLLTGSATLQAALIYDQTRRP